MICLDTTFLVHLWRHRTDKDHPVHRVLFEHAAEVFAVPVTAAGEFLEGAAFVSGERLADGTRFLSMFRIGDASFETARHYASLTAELRRSTGRGFPGGSMDRGMGSTAHCHTGDDQR